MSELKVLRFVEAEYIDSGTFVAGEEDIFHLHYDDPEKGKRHELVLVRRVDVEELNRRAPAPEVEALRGALSRVLDCIADRKLEICVDCLKLSSAALSTHPAAPSVKENTDG